MKKYYPTIVSLLIIITILAVIFFTMMPKFTSNQELSFSEFSTPRALEQVKNIAQKPHYVGSENHDFVAHYLSNELQNMGMEVSTQEGNSFAYGTLTHCKNIIARLKGTDSKKALLLLSHYDSAPHSASLGASDAGTGIATILESIRAFTYNKKRHKNDIIILFSDAEEINFNGAALFVTQHKWAKEIGLVLNFEARGSAGPSYMFMESNSGNAGLVNEFSNANVQYPVANSLMYSIYKMMPNDTDLTIFREQANIQGFNFAFIDGHYNYHTAQDDVAHLDQNSLSHQGEYLMPMLEYFSNADLNQTHTTQDSVYFSIPFAFINYPFDWVVPMALTALGLLFLLTFIGVGKRVLSGPQIARGFLPFIGSVLVAGFSAFLGWKLLLAIYPEYSDLLNGFTYNGHDYILAFTMLSLAICFAFYQSFANYKAEMSYFFAPLFCWILLNIFLAMQLPGAGFLIIPAYCGLLMLAFYILSQRSIWLLNIVLSIPTLLLLVPFIYMFPIGLGLKILFVSAILTVLAFGLLLPVLESFAQKGFLSLLFILLAAGFFAKANYESGYENGKAKSNSLVYILDADANKANWATYDLNLDQWTKTYLGQNPKNAQTLNNFPLTNKYNSGFTFTADAPLKNIPKPSIEFLKDTIVRGNRYLKIRITPNRKVNRYDVFANENLIIQNFKANGLALLGQKGSKYERKSKKLMSYYVVDNLPFEIEFNVNAASVVSLDLMESSFDLMSHASFEMTKRSNWMMPTPFILNDAIIIKQKIKPAPKKVKPIAIPLENTIPKDSLIQTKDSLKI